MPFSHDEMDLLRAESKTHHTNTLIEMGEMQKRQSLRRKLLLAFALIATSFAISVITAAHWHAISFLTKG